jgi:hypothetical protein
MKLGPMTRKWLITIIVAIAVALLALWLYTGYAAEEVEPDVADDEVSLHVAQTGSEQPADRPLHPLPLSA